MYIQDKTLPGEEVSSLLVVKGWRVVMI